MRFRICPHIHPDRRTSTIRTTVIYLDSGSPPAQWREAECKQCGRIWRERRNP